MSLRDAQGELQPLAGAKKENADLKPVVVMLQRVEEVQLRGDKTPQYWLRTPVAWYALATPLPRYVDFWKAQERNVKVGRDECRAWACALTQFLCHTSW